MKKLLLFPLLLITFFAFSQTTPVTVTFRKQTTATDSKDSLAYTYPGKIGNYSYWGNLELMRSLFKLQSDSVSNSGYVTHGYFNAHSGGSATTIYTGNGVIPALRQVKLEGSAAELFIGDTSNTTGIDVRTNTARKIAVDISAQNDSTLSKSADIVLSDNVVQFTSNTVGGNIMQFIMGGGPAHNRMWVYDYQQRGLLSAGDYSAFQISNDSAYTSRKAVNLLITANPSNFIGLSALSATSPIFYNNSTGVISSQAATSSVNGYLTAANFNTFNSKQNAITTGSTSQYIRGDLSLATFPTLNFQNGLFNDGSGNINLGGPLITGGGGVYIDLNGEQFQFAETKYNSITFGAFPSATTPSFAMGTNTGSIVNFAAFDNDKIRLNFYNGSSLTGIQFGNTNAGIRITDQNSGIGLVADASIDTANMTANGNAYVTQEWVMGHLSGGGSGITALTADVTASGSGSVVATLATVNSNVGTFGGATHVPAITVNGKGLTTAVTSTAITFPVTSVFGRTGAVVSATNDYTFAQIGSKPTTLSGYGITDAYPLSGNPSSFLTANQSITFTATGDVTGSASGGTSLTPALTIGAGKVTNAMLAGSITNANLLNSSTTINGTAISLGASGTVTAAASTLTGSTLSSGVTSSSLTAFGSSPTLNTAVLTGLPTGTGVSNASTASTLAARDANSNLYANAFHPGFTTIVSSATPIVLTVGSTQVQEITGSTAQTVTLPVASTLTTGWTVIITSASSATITVQSSGGNTVATLVNGNTATVWCVLASGTGLSSWDRSLGSGSFTGTGGSMVLATGSTLTSPTIQTILTLNATANLTKTNIAATSTDGLYINNNQAATSGVPRQFGPRIRLGSAGWTGSASQTADWILENQPVNGTSPITANLVISSQVNSGGYTPRLLMADNGNTTFAGNLILGTVGNGIAIKEGTNAAMGIGTLSGGTLVISNTRVTANSRIFLTDQGGTVTNLGSLYISARSAGTSFTVNSSNVLDASTFAWEIKEPAP